MAANPRTITRSFHGGEISPDFYGRIDNAKYQAGLALCRNWIAKPHGPIDNRAGTHFVAETKDSAKRSRLVPFEFGSEQSLVVEIGAGFFRFYKDGAVLLSAPGVTLEVANPYTEAHLRELKYVQSNDIMTITHPAYPSAELRRLSATSWDYAVIDFAPKLTPPPSVRATATPKATDAGTPTLQSYVVTAVDATGREESIASSGGAALRLTDVSLANPGVFTSDDLTTTTLPVGTRIFVDGIGGMPTLNGKYYEVASFVILEEEFFGGGEFGGGPSGRIRTGFAVTLRDPVTDVALSTVGLPAYAGGGTLALAEGGARCSNNLFDSGAYNTVSWARVEGATRYYVYKLTNGLFAYIGQTEAESFTDDGIAGDTGRTPPRFDELFTKAGDYPAACGYFEQRRWFAGTTNTPAQAWATRTGTERNMSYSIPQRDDDRINFTLAARRRNAIRHVFPMANLLLLTDTAEWRIAPLSGGDDGLTPLVSAKPQSDVGAGHATPVLANNNLIFAAARGGHLRELAYRQEANGYLTGDLSLFVPYRFDGAQIVDLAYSKTPFPVVWAVLSSGTLAGLTYVPEQEVGAWHFHDTDGAIESATVVMEGRDDVLYLLVNRTVRGATRRYVERMAPRWPYEADARSAYFVDCGLTYDGPPTTVFTGLDHLEGCTVSILADGKVQPQQPVSAGRVTLAEAAGVVHIGLPYQSDLRTLPIAIDGPAFGQGRPKNVAAVWARVFATRGLKAGPSFDRLRPVQLRRGEAAGLPPDVESREIEAVLSGAWNDEGQVCIRQSDPLPATLVSLTTEFAIGG